MLQIFFYINGSNHWAVVQGVSGCKGTPLGTRWKGGAETGVFRSKHPASCSWSPHKAVSLHTQWQPCRETVGVCVKKERMIWPWVNFCLMWSLVSGVVLNLRRVWEVEAGAQRGECTDGDSWLQGKAVGTSRAPWSKSVGVLFVLFQFYYTF